MIKVAQHSVRVFGQFPCSSQFRHSRMVSFWPWVPFLIFRNRNNETGSGQDNEMIVIENRK